MQIKEEIVKSIDMDITSYEDYLKEVAELMLSNKVSKYPIFVLHQERAIQLGSPIIDAFRSKTKWSSENLCIFVFDPQNAGFIFRPFSIKYEG